MRPSAPKWLFLWMIVYAGSCGDVPHEGVTSPMDAEGNFPEQTRHGDSRNDQGDRARVEVSRLPQLTIDITQARFFSGCGMLCLEVRIWNDAPDPVYIVANQFAYVDFGPGASRHDIVPILHGKELILDLSHVMPTREGIDYYTGEAGSFGPHDYCIQVNAHEVRSCVYVFQFPLHLSRFISPIGSFPWPDAVTAVRVRLGCSTEPQESFRIREIESAENAADWQKRLVDEWQIILDSKPIALESSVK